MTYFENGVTKNRVELPLMFFHEMICVIFSFDDMHRNFLLARGFFGYYIFSMNKIT